VGLTDIIMFIIACSTVPAWRSVMQNNFIC